MGNNQDKPQQKANNIVNRIPWGFVHSLRYHENHECLHHSYFYFGKDSATNQYYGSYAQRPSSHAPKAENADYELIGPRYSVCWLKPTFGKVRVTFSNPAHDHKLELTLFEDRLLEITVVDGLVLPVKTHLHIHLQITI